jgi:hypothetical protein
MNPWCICFHTGVSLCARWHTRSAHWVSSLGISHLSFETGSLTAHEAYQLTRLAWLTGWLLSSRDLPAPPCLAPSLKCTVPSLSMGARNLNSSLYACMAGPSPAEPSTFRTHPQCRVSQACCMHFLHAYESRSPRWIWLSSKWEIVTRITNISL